MTAYVTFTCTVCGRRRKESNPRLGEVRTICAQCSSFTPADEDLELSPAHEAMPWAPPPGAPYPQPGLDRAVIIAAAAQAFVQGDSTLSSAYLALLLRHGPVLAVASEYGAAVLAAYRALEAVTND